MIVLSLGTDQRISDPESATRKRLISYSKDPRIAELHVVVPAKEARDHEVTEEKLHLHLVSGNTKLRAYYNAYTRLKELAYKKKGTSTLITTQDPSITGILGLRVAQKTKLPLHVQIHTDIYSKAFWRHTLKNKLAVILARYVIKRATHLRVVSKRVLQNIQAKHPQILASVRPIATTYSAPQEKTESKAFRVMYLGRIASEKNIDGLIDAFKAYRRKDTDARLTIIGNGSEKEALQRRTKNIPEITWKGWTDNPYTEYRTADVVVINSYYEGWSLVAIEAVLSGTPVIMTNVGAAGEYIKDDVHGMILKSHKVKELINALAAMKQQHGAYRARISKDHQALYQKLQNAYQGSVVDDWYETIQKHAK